MPVKFPSFQAMQFWTLALILPALPVAFAAFSPVPFSYMPPVLGILLLLLARISQGRWPEFDWPLYLWALGACALGSLSTMWSVDPAATLERSLKVGIVVLGALPLIDLARACPPEKLQRWAVFLPGAAIVAGLGPLIELCFGFPLSRFFARVHEVDPAWEPALNKNVSAFIVMLPAAFYICHKTGTYSLGLLLAIIAGILAAVTHSQASQLALIVLPLAWLSLFVLPVAGIPSIFAATALIVLLMPWLSPLAFAMFADQFDTGTALARQAAISLRLETWDFIARRIMDRPWVGFGMDATRHLQFDTARLYYPGNRIPYPHNLALQIWIEFGAGGVLLLLGFLGFLLRRMLRLDKAQRRLAFTVYCTAMVFFLVAWSVWASWLLGLIVTLAAFTVLALRTSNARAIS